MEMELKCLLKVRLAEKEMKLKELSEMTGIHYTHLSGINRGKIFPELPTAYKIAEAMDMLIEDIWIKK